MGLERAIPNLETAWQVEIEPFCRKVLKHHWPNSKIYNDITKINTKELESIDMLCGGFPCQDISSANYKGEGLNGKRSGLFWELWGIVRDFREQGRTIPIVVLENVPAITFRGLGDVLKAFSQIGYDAEYFTIRASDFGAPHRRERWFGVFYTSNTNKNNGRQVRESFTGQTNKNRLATGSHLLQKKPENATNTNKTQCQRNRGSVRIQTSNEKFIDNIFVTKRTESFWREKAAESPLCSLDDGIPNRLARYRALGNAIVPQCSEFVGKLILASGLWRDAIC